MAGSSDGEFNPWPAFVDIFSAVILVMLLLLMVVLANLGYFSQFKYKVSYSGAVSSDDIIRNNNKTTEENVETAKASSSSAAAVANADHNAQVISEQKQMIIALQKQIASEDGVKSAKGMDEIESGGINVADKKDNTKDIQKMVTADEYLIITYKADELFVDDGISKQLKQFLETAKNKYKTFQIVILSSDMKDQLSATISKQISLARTMSVRNLIKKFGYEKKDTKIDLSNPPEIKETIDSKNGYIVIKIVK